MKTIILNCIILASTLTGSIFANDYNPYTFRSEKQQRQLDQLQRDVDRLPRYGHMKPDSSGGYYYTY